MSAAIAAGSPPGRLATGQARNRSPGGCAAMALGPTLSLATLTNITIGPDPARQ
ncbi:hypothetical protein [Nocardia sp. bgisy118]|uniref:hypothetical protein n=1 Tax=Nocardia sp. bgisy118 TaxID=3413786 RepID=UPI003F49BD39